MDNDSLYLNILAETLTDRASNATEEEKQKVFHFKSFIQIMTTLKEIIKKQDEISHEIEELVKTQDLLKSEIEKIQQIDEKIDEISTMQTTAKTELEKIQLLNTQMKKLNEYFANIYTTKLSWGKVKVWGSAFIAALGLILSAMAWLNQMGVFSIIWNAKK